MISEGAQCGAWVELMVCRLAPGHGGSHEDEACNTGTWAQEDRPCRSWHRRRADTCVLSRGHGGVHEDEHGQSWHDEPCIAQNWDCDAASGDGKCWLPNGHNGGHVDQCGHAWRDRVWLECRAEDPRTPGRRCILHAEHAADPKWYWHEDRIGMAWHESRRFIGLDRYLRDIDVHGSSLSLIDMERAEEQYLAERDSSR